MVKNILLIDDDKPLLKMLDCYFTKHGYRFFTTSTGAGAMAVLEAEAIDLILLDLKLGEEDGIDIGKRIKKDFPRMPIIILSGYLTDREAGLCREAGFDHALSKPAGLAMLRGIIADYGDRS